ncbi:MAG TPA: hypothetical protein VH540_26395 [Ktedonobacterales bacterium]|jgi:hypothetical protein
MSVEHCGSCGKPLIPGQLFCQHCGARNDDNATRVEQVSQPPGSGPRGAMHCGNCGFLLTAQDRTCRRCGAPVGSLSPLVVDESINDAPTLGVSFQDPQASFQTRGAAAPATGYPPQPQISQPYNAPYHPAPSPVPYDAPTFSAVSPYSQPSGPARSGPGYRDGPPPGYPTAPPPKKSRWPLIIGLVIVGVLLIAGGGAVLALTSGNSPQTGDNPTATTAPIITATTVVTAGPTQVVLTTESATALVNQFYADINARDFDAAYDLLSQSYQQKQSRQSFKNGFLTTVQDNLTIQGAQTLSNGTIQVNVMLVALDNKNGSQVTTTYTGYYIVILEKGALRIDRGSLQKQG